MSGRIIGRIERTADEPEVCADGWITPLDTEVGFICGGSEADEESESEVDVDDMALWNV